SRITSGMTRWKGKGNSRECPKRFRKRRRGARPCAPTASPAWIRCSPLRFHTRLRLPVGRRPPVALHPALRLRLSGVLVVEVLVDPALLEHREDVEGEVVEAEAGGEAVEEEEEEGREGVHEDLLLPRHRRARGAGELDLRYHRDPHQPREARHEVAVERDREWQVEDGVRRREGVRPEERLLPEHERALEEAPHRDQDGVLEE